MSDVIVIGAGLAGLTCSVKLAESGVNVRLVSPSPSERAQSVMAMGGINAALNTKGEDDSVEEHYDDTMNGGQQINNRKAVKRLTRDAPDIIDWLSSIGTSFTRDEMGNVDLRYFGGQKKMRTAYAGSRTGKQLLTAINAQARKYESEGKIERLLGYRFLSLITSEDKSECLGAVVINEYDDKIESLIADSVVIASGGMNKLFGKISGSMQNDASATSRLLKQGVELANLEMIQYHPTTIKTPVKRMLITEATRGEGGRLYTLRDDEKWYFMEEWYPEFGALMPRDVVSQSIYKVCDELGMGIGGEKIVHLDVSHLSEKTVKVKLDEVYEVCTQYLGIDPTVEPIPVYPGVHYFMGGIRTDDKHRTNIRGLYAVGECSSQYHGANRLGGNSLLGAIHGGWIVSQEIANSNNPGTTPDKERLADETLQKEKQKYTKWKQIQDEENNISSYEIEDKISEIMNKAMAIYRNGEDLRDAYDEIIRLEENINAIGSHDSYYEYISTVSLIPLAKAMILSALERKESRGAHQRTDYPEKDDDKYRKSTVIQYKKDEYIIKFRDTEEEMVW